MNLDFSTGQITIIIAPVDLRASYARLSAIAQALFNIDVNAGGQYVLFISRARKIAKLIWSDEHGNSCLTRRLHSGRFEQLMAASESASKQLTVSELMSYLDGQLMSNIQLKDGSLS